MIYILLFATFITSCAIKLTDDKKNYLKNELQEIVKTDQVAAFHLENQWAKYKDSVFTIHKIQVEKMFKIYGYLAFDKVGEGSSNNFWLIV